MFLHDPDASIQRFVDPLGHRCSPTGQVMESSCGPLGVTTTVLVRLELPSWTVLVPFEVVGSDRLADSVAGSLDIRETASGFTVVEASGDSELAEAFGEAGGTQLAFGDAAAISVSPPSARFSRREDAIAFGLLDVRARTDHQPTTGETCS